MCLRRLSEYVSVKKGGHRGAGKYSDTRETVGPEHGLVTPDTKHGKWNEDVQGVTGERTSNGHELIEISYMKLSSRALSPRGIKHSAA